MGGDGEDDADDNTWCSPDLSANAKNSEVYWESSIEGWQLGCLQDTPKSGKPSPQLLLEVIRDDGDVMAWTTCALTQGTVSKKRSCTLSRPPVRPELKETDELRRRLPDARLDVELGWTTFGGNKGHDEPRRSSKVTAPSPRDAAPSTYQSGRATSAKSDASERRPSRWQEPEATSPVDDTVEFGRPASTGMLKGLPNGAWIRSKRKSPPSASFRGKDGFDLYIDSARFLPYNVTISKV
jgi:hypothetical protein